MSLFSCCRGQDRERERVVRQHRVRGRAPSSAAPRPTTCDSSWSARPRAAWAAAASATAGTSSSTPSTAPRASTTSRRSTAAPSAAPRPQHDVSALLSATGSLNEKMLANVMAEASWKTQFEASDR
ncbi:hypothetical protein CDAR_517591 [Caerostris darwini]|uniref:Uncharacterized protein n=1 Tax=Caerostris darwini TaxID=1538125 RepID=A0AAV4PNQ1_9ARAC|nr:hypothetical protein CDAR_517591 [Caerostris darwini]